VGTGNWKNEFALAFKKNNSKLDKTLYASSHNQYLNFMVKFGVIGFLFIFFILIFPIIKTNRYRDGLFLVFLIFMFFANFADSNLESHMGSSFFLFFYCLFVITNGNNYFKIEKS
jgi:O-antigen ligase